MTPSPGKKPTARDLSLARPDKRPGDAVASVGVGGATARLAADSPAAPISAPPHRRSRLTTVLASLLIAVGLLVLADAVVTLAWQEPVSALLAQLKQEGLGSDLHALDSAPLSQTAKFELARLHEQRRRIEYLAGELQLHAKDGSAVGRIDIPTIGASFVMVKGTGTSELESGPGIYSETAFPGVPGTTAIAGHRTTWLAPFRHIDALRPGQPIVLEMPYARFTYRVIGSRVVLPTDVSVLDPVGYSRLVLSACTPLFSASHRLIVFARLSSMAPLGAARIPFDSKRAGQSLGPEPALPTVLKPRQRLLAPLVS
jgi:sortase A